MRKLLSFTLIWLLGSAAAYAQHSEVIMARRPKVSGGGGGIALVASCVATNTGTCTINSTGATLIIVDQLTGGTGTIGSPPTENKGNTFQTPAASGCAITTNGVVQGYYIFNPTVGSGHIFTAHGSGNVYFVSAWSGALTTSGVFIGANCHSQLAGGGTTFATGSVTTTATNQLVFTMAANVDTSGAWTVPASFTLVNNSTSFGAEATSYFVDPSTGAINPSWTDAANDSFVGNTMVFTHP